MALDATSGASPSLDDSPTLTLAATAGGQVLGTAGYMAPEQARGSAVDKRVDVWAFGVCLFEALTARSAFGGDTVSDRLASVLKEEPRWDSLPADTPRALNTLLRRCLKKTPADRLRDIGEARIALTELLADPAAAAQGGESADASPRRCDRSPGDGARRRRRRRAGLRRGDLAPAAR